MIMSPDHDQQTDQITVVLSPCRATAAPFSDHLGYAFIWLGQTLNMAQPGSLHLRSRETPKGLTRTQWARYKYHRSMGIVRTQSRNPHPEFGGYGQSSFLFWESCKPRYPLQIDGIVYLLCFQLWALRA